MRPISTLPRVEGYKFIGVTRSGERLSCHLVKLPSGKMCPHHDRRCYCGKLVGWLPLDNGAEVYI